MKLVFVSLLVLGLCTPVHAQPVPFYEPVDISQFPQNISERGEKLEEELKTLTVDLEKELDSLENTGQHFETMLNMVNEVLDYLDVEGEFVTTLHEYHNYAKDRARSLKNHRNPRMQKFAMRWAERVTRVEKLLEEVAAKRLEGLKELKLIEDNQVYAVELARLEWFDHAMDAAQESLDKVGGIITDMKSFSEQVSLVEDDYESE
jgi:hypothetical protein